MKGLLDRLFGTNKAEVALSAVEPSAQLQVREFSERLITIDALDFVGQFAKSPNGQFRLIWSDCNPEGTIGGNRAEGHGRWALLEQDRLICEGRLERPQGGKVANDGTLILNDWMFGEGLKGRFVAFRRDGTAIMALNIAANLISNGLSNDGTFAICQTANAPGSPDSCLYMLFDLTTAAEIARWEPETGWADGYEFDTAARQLFLIRRYAERIGYRFDGTMIDRDGWQTHRVAAGDLTAIRSLLGDAGQVRDADFVARIIAGLERAAQDNDVYVRARALRIRGELLEETGDGAAALVAYDEALALDPQVGVTRRADKLRKALSPGSTPVRKLSKFERQAERVGIVHEVIALHCGEPKLWRYHPKDAWASVEEAALAHYVAQGWSGAAAEGGLMLTLIKAASFARLQPRNADTYIEALYAQNVAFDEDRFSRGALIDACGRATTAQLSRNWAMIAATAGETPAFYPRVRWDHVSGLFDALGTERLAAIARLFADAPYDLRAGWPDLTLWRDREVRFAEIKAPSDSMHASQTRLITTILKPLGYQVTLAEVRPA
ncbi:VRR-NUC domain-containing protein [Sphingobium sp. WTD-1]|uniref:VRR-NUC domain-containing protein n=1 Tax=Sphingobium sp. WTD-1 TaxID=2979467 RepID=UPI0024DE4CA0|nr:VRR-NUC domain-containing protein [Sphingobium sp. WTD-1]WIA56685.1 VRR-NUC domain-containing protein [Sphingobium sp. WTD-1]